MSFKTTRRYARLAVLAIAAALGFAACARLGAQDPATAPAADDQKKVKTVDWDAIVGKTLGVKGTLVGNVYTVMIPRTDLDDEDVDTMGVPAGAICSTFHFFPCSCGMLRVVGEFVVLDYEANDVISALHDGKFLVASMGTAFINERPHHAMVLRFQGEGHGTEVVTPIREAMRWMGDERSKPGPIGGDANTTGTEGVR